MAVINGTIRSVHILTDSLASTKAGARKCAVVVADFAAYTGAADTATITGVGAAILASIKNGKTITLRGGLCHAPGEDTAGQDVYFTGTAVQAATVSTDDLTGQLSVAAGTEVTTTTGTTTGVQVLALFDES